MEGKIIRTYPAGIPVTRERILPNVGRIVIDEDEIQILHSAGQRDSFERGDWRLFVEDIRQAQDEIPWAKRPARTLFLMEGGEMVGFEECSCRIIEDEKVIFCGKRPETMGYL